MVFLWYPRLYFFNRSQSGTGKTATFSVSVLQCLDIQVIGRVCVGCGQVIGRVCVGCGCLPYPSRGGSELHSRFQASLGYIVGPGNSGLHRKALTVSRSCLPT
jgi:hypothetical protein